MPLGFVTAVVTAVLAQPTWSSWQLGLMIAIVGELIRIWAAGHLEKGREVTRSGPYRWSAHPLYVGSVIMGAGVAIAAANWIIAAVIAVYLVVTLTAAIRTEEASLDAKFEGAYADYRAGLAPPVSRPFSLDRVKANREYRSALGLIAGFAILYLRSRW